MNVDSNNKLNQFEQQTNLKLKQVIRDELPEISLIKDLQAAVEKQESKKWGEQIR